MKKWIAIAGAVLAAIAMASIQLGCSDSAPAPRVAPANFTPVKLRLDWLPSPEYLGYYTADALGYYAARELDVKIAAGTSAEWAARSLSDGSVPLATSTVEAIVRLALTPPDSPAAGPRPLPVIRMIVTPVSPVVLILRPGQQVQKIEDLKGRTIGYTFDNAADYRQFLALLAMRPEIQAQVELKPVALENINEFKAGKVDAILSFKNDVPVELELQKVPFSMVKLSDLGLDMPTQCVATAPGSTLDPAKLQALLEACIGGWEFARENPDQAEKLFVEKFPTQNPEKVRLATAYSLEFLPPPGTEGNMDAYLGLEQRRALVRRCVDLLLPTLNREMPERERDELVSKLIGQPAA